MAIVKMFTNRYFVVLIVGACMINVIVCQESTGDKNIYLDSDLQKEFLDVFTKDVPKPPVADIEVRTKLGVEKDKVEKEKFANIKPGTFFFDANPVYREAIMEYKDLLLNKSSLKELFEAASEYRDEINFSLWLHGYIGAILKRNSGLNSFLPLIELKPDLMISERAINDSMTESLKPGNARKCVVVVDKEAGKINGIENELWYFREDVMFNSHHWYWHLIYPVFRSTSIPRAGELFYYMHHGILARYHAERLSNGLPPVEPLEITPNGIVKERYHSFLKDTNSGKQWTNRPPNTHFSDVHRVVFFDELQNNLDVDIYVAEHQVEGNRLIRAANSGLLRTPNGGSPINLKNLDGIDILSKSAESVINIRANGEYYGDYHNQGHFLIAFIQDPRGLLNQPPGVMADTATAVRDIVFYRWHTVVDIILKKHKDTLTPYSPREGELQLAWPGIEVKGIEIKTVGRKTEPPVNTFYTFWRERRFDLSKGLDFKRTAPNSGPVDVCVDHLDHDEFNYQITVAKTSQLGNNLRATIRIFLAPRLNERGGRYTMEEQRNLFFVLDTFTVILNNATNVISRNSKTSELTLEYVKSLQNLENDVNNERPRCGCGWPHHLLIPKGKPRQGMVFDLFVMVTNGNDDQVVQDSPVNIGNTCSQGYLYCGLINQKYPDSKPMGYPFDRKVYTVVDSDGRRRPVANLEEYVRTIPNMNTIQVKVIHEPDRKERATTYS